MKCPGPGVHVYTPRLLQTSNREIMETGGDGEVTGDEKLANAFQEGESGSNL
jgi:hypothetical protein